jgi:hypothetical protein
MTGKEFEKRLEDLAWDEYDGVHTFEVKQLILDLIGDDESLHMETQTEAVYQIRVRNHFRDRLRAIVKGDKDVV